MRVHSQYAEPELTAREMRNTNPVVISYILPIFLSRDTHDRPVFKSNIQTPSSPESLLASSYRPKPVRLRRSGANVHPQNVSSQARIARDLELIRVAEQQHLPATQQGVLWDQLALEYHGATEFLKAEDAYNKSLHLLKTAPSAREQYASTLDNLASLYLIYGRLDDAESARKQALKVRQKLGNPTDIAISEVHLADIALARHQFKKAERLALRGLQDLESSSHPPGVGVLSAFITLTYARCSLGHYGEGLMNAEQAVAFANRNFEPESAATAFALETLGYAEWQSGASQDAREGHASRYPDTSDKAGSGRSSFGRRPAAIPSLPGCGQEAGGSTRDSGAS